ncbi:AMMECR1 domain-containing protein [Candidatus Aerophobetes bacterium]|uniref:AMMECR1 domain-containing protein n=1 Tax=Aerophobetes bacterium TaxID=2030807 RepID=A0A497E4M5_UNCAE|nr:AmmeMemoRadiSam system protein A [Candidatus Aerophobetes bacterium]RLE09233.1 MAG: AMMECR1 domain-containing protein [Candidatus Aerophobetes bacterium]
MNEKVFPVLLARKTIEAYIRQGKIISPPEDIPEAFQKKAGVFVSLHKKGRLRGCIGTYLPTQENIAQEIIKNAISAATQDPRFPPVEEDELKDLEISVDILSEPEPVHSKQELDPKKYGVIVSKGWRRGLLLPDLEGVNTVEEQLDIAKQKAGLYGVPDEELEIERFTVTRYKE